MPALGSSTRDIFEALDLFEAKFVEYLEFLVVKGLERDFNTMKIPPPCAIADSFWHEHILHTAAYHSTCMHLFGQYLHHKPGVELPISAYWVARAKHFPDEDEYQPDEEEFSTCG